MPVYSVRYKLNGSRIAGAYINPEEAMRAGRHYFGVSDDRLELITVNSNFLAEDAEEPAEETGRKHDDGKIRPTLMPPAAEREVHEVLAFGARKYDADNWRKVPDAQTRYLDAAMRHILAYRSGEALDEESSLHHLAHAVASLMFVLELTLADDVGAAVDTDAI